MGAITHEISKGMNEITLVELVLEIQKSYISLMRNMFPLQKAYFI